MVSVASSVLQSSVLFGVERITWEEEYYYFFFAASSLLMMMKKIVLDSCQQERLLRGAARRFPNLLELPLLVLFAHLFLAWWCTRLLVMMVDSSSLMCSSTTKSHRPTGSSNHRPNRESRELRQ
jgi:hypothetical protein